MPKELHNSQTQFLDYYHEYLPIIYRYIGLRIGNRQQTEDLVSDTFLKALEHFPQYTARPNISFKSWLFKIAKNTLIDFYRKNKKPMFSLEDVPDMSDPTPLPDHSIDNKMIISKAKNIIEALPKKQQEVVTLRLFGELRNKEIAEILSLSEKTIASTYMRALRKISSKLNPLL